jgi:hypothetical protein
LNLSKESIPSGLKLGAPSAPSAGLSATSTEKERSATDDDEDDDVESYFPDPLTSHANCDVLQAGIDAAEAVLVSSSASQAERFAAEQRLWFEYDLPYVSPPAMGRAHAALRVKSFLDTFAGGADEADNDTNSKLE